MTLKVKGRIKRFVSKNIKKSTKINSKTLKLSRMKHCHSIKRPKASLFRSSLSL